MIYRYKDSIISRIFSLVAIAISICCMMAAMANAQAEEPFVGEYNMCLAKYQPSLSVTNHTLKLEESGKLSLSPNDVSGRWVVNDGKIQIKLDDGRLYSGCVKDGFMALATSGGEAEMLIAARQSASKGASCYTTSGEVYNPFAYNTLCVIDKETSTGTGRFYWCDESIRFMFRLECNDSLKNIFRGFPVVEGSGAFHAGIEPPAGAGEKSNDLQGFTTEDGSLFCAAGKLATRSKNISPIFTIGLKRQQGTADGDRLRFRLVSIGTEWPDDSVLQLSGNSWLIKSGEKTLDSGKILQIKNSLCVLKENQRAPITVLVDLTRRFAIVKWNQRGNISFSIGFLEDDK